MKRKNSIVFVILIIVSISLCFYPHVLHEAHTTYNVEPLFLYVLVAWPAFYICISYFAAALILYKCHPDYPAPFRFLYRFIGLVLGSLWLAATLILCIVHLSGTGIAFLNPLLLVLEVISLHPVVYAVLGICLFLCGNEEKRQSQ